MNWARNHDSATQMLFSCQKRDQVSENCENNEYKNKKQWQKKDDNNEKIFQQKHHAYIKFSWNKKSHDEKNKLNSYSRIKNSHCQNLFHDHDQACDQKHNQSIWSENDDDKNQHAEFQNSWNDENTACWTQQEKCIKQYQNKYSDYKCNDFSTNKYFHSEKAHSTKNASWCKNVSLRLSDCSLLSMSVI